MVTGFEDIRIAVETIGDGGIEMDLELAPDAVAEFLDDDQQMVAPLKVHYAAKLKGSEILVSAQLSGVVEVICCRCLGDMQHAIDLNLETVYLPATAEMEGDLEADRESSEIGYYRKEIRLGEYLLSEMGLSMPLRHVCSEDCKGLCSECGANLNIGSCSCEVAVDPRFAKLAGLKKDN